MPVDLIALERAARNRLDPSVYDYFASGAHDELTVADNVAAWQRIRLRPRVLRDVSNVSLATMVLGAEVSMPVLLAPTRLPAARGGAGHRQGRGGGRHGDGGVDFSTVAMEDIADAAPGGP